jgi:hypothetical protein
VWGPQTQGAWDKAKRKTGMVGLKLLTHLAPYGGFRAVA